MVEKLSEHQLAEILAIEHNNHEYSFLHLIAVANPEIRGAILEILAEKYPQQFMEWLKTPNKRGITPCHLG
jgi:hypothetical protein